jgi:hypothetical protein
MLTAGQEDSYGMPLARRWRSPRLRGNWGNVAVAVWLTAVVVVSLVVIAARDQRPLALVLIPGALATVLLRRRVPVKRCWWRSPWSRQCRTIGRSGCL